MKTSEMFFFVKKSTWKLVDHKTSDTGSCLSDLFFIQRFPFKQHFEGFFIFLWKIFSTWCEERTLLIHEIPCWYLDFQLKGIKMLITFFSPSSPRSNNCNNIQFIIYFNSIFHFFNVPLWCSFYALVLVVKWCQIYSTFL